MFCLTTCFGKGLFRISSLQFDPEVWSIFTDFYADFILKLKKMVTYFINTVFGNVLILNVWYSAPSINPVNSTSSVMSPSDNLWENTDRAIGVFVTVFAHTHLVLAEEIPWFRCWYCQTRLQLVIKKIKFACRHHIFLV